MVARGQLSDQLAFVCLVGKLAYAHMAKSKMSNNFDTGLQWAMLIAPATKNEQLVEESMSKTFRMITRLRGYMHVAFNKDSNLMNETA